MKKDFNHIIKTALVSGKKITAVIGIATLMAICSGCTHSNHKITNEERQRISNDADKAFKDLNNRMYQDRNQKCK